MNAIPGKQTADSLMKSIEASVHELALATDEAKRSDYFKQFLKTMGLFWGYSFSNQMLIHLQNPNATRVAGFNTWIKLGRHVKAGEHGIKILAPGSKKVSRLDKTTGEETEGIARYFFPVTVFDVSQTEGDPLPTADIDVHGNDFEWLRIQLLQGCQERGIKVEFKDLGINGAYGFASESKGIVLGLGQEVNTLVNTLIHEMTHMMLHVGKEDRPSKADREIEAEGTAYVVMLHFGIRPHSPNYLAMYHADEKKIMARMKAISDTSREIIGMINAKPIHKPDSGLKPSKEVTHERR
jgi:hypothetical protein